MSVSPRQWRSAANRSQERSDWGSLLRRQNSRKPRSGSATRRRRSARRSGRAPAAPRSATRRARASSSTSAAIRGKIAATRAGRPSPTPGRGDRLRGAAGADQQPEPELARPDSRGSRARQGRRGRIPGQPHGRPGPTRSPGPGRHAGRAAAGAGAGSRVHPGRRGYPGRLPGLVPAAAGELLARGGPTGYDKTAASTWGLAFDRLQQTAPGAVGLLRLLAFARPRQSRCACCCNHVPGSPSSSPRRWFPC